MQAHMRPQPGFSGSSRGRKVDGMGLGRQAHRLILSQWVLRLLGW